MNMSPKKHVLLALSFVMTFVWFGGCVKAKVASYPNKGYAPTNPANVQVFNMKPPADFEVIGEVVGRGAPAASWDSVYSGMKKEAAKIGGDAIILIESKREFIGTYNTPDTGSVFVSGNYVYYTHNPGTSTPMMRKHGIGIVIKWKTR